MNYTSTMQTKTDERPLPEGWQLIQIGKICQPIRGVTFQSGEAIALPFEDSIACITTSGVQDKIDWESRRFIPKSRLSSDQQVLRLGDIVVSTANSKALVGKSCVVSELPFPCTFGAFVTVLRLTSSDVDSTYLAHWFRSPDVLAYFFEVSANTTNISNLKVTDILAIEIPLPPLNEQRRIARRLNDQLATAESARKAAEEQLHAAYDLPLAYLRDVFESKVAKHWQSKFIGDLAETCSGSTPLRSRSDYYVDGTIPWVKTGELKDGIIDDTEEHITELALKESSLKLLPEKTLLIAMYGQGQTRGRTTIISKPMTVNQACFAIMPNESFDTEFLQFWFRYSYDRLRKETEGRGGNQPNLNGQVLNKQKTLLPPVDEQKQIVKSLKKELQQSETLQDNLESQLAEIERLPASLLREAFTGQG